MTIIKSKILNFFYETVLTDLADSSEQRVYILGSRGVGKTVFINRLKNQIKAEDDNFIDGADRHIARKRIQSIKADHSSDNPTILIDNLDHLLRFEATTSPNEYETFVEEFMNLVAEVSTSGKLIITTTVPPEEMADELSNHLFNDEKEKQEAFEKFSDLFSRWHLISLTPWPWGWWHSFDRAFEEWFPVKNQYLEPLRNEIISMTGGHPCLLGPAMNELDRFFKDKDSKQSFFELKFEERTSFFTYLEDLLTRTGLRTIRKALEDLRDSTVQINRDSFNSLVLMSQGLTSETDHIDETVIPPNIRGTLVEKALLRQDRDGRYRVPGKLIISEILGQKSILRTIKTITLNPSDGSSQDGLLKTGNNEFHFAGSQWQLLSYFFQRKGEIIAISEVKKHLNLGTDNAARSAIQRLDARLKNHSLNFLTNIHGRGYKFSI